VKEGGKGVKEEEEDKKSKKKKKKKTMLEEFEEEEEYAKKLREYRILRDRHLEEANKKMDARCSAFVRAEG